MSVSDTILTLTVNLNARAKYITHILLPNNNGIGKSMIAQKIAGAALTHGIDTQIVRMTISLGLSAAERTLIEYPVLRSNR